MTPDEFRDVFNRHYLVHYPDLREWARSIPPETKEKWAELFEPHVKIDLVKAIQNTVAGVSPPIAAYDRDRTATILLQRTREILQARMDRERRRETAERYRAEEIQARGKSLGDAMADRLMANGLGPALREINDRVDAGEDRATVTAEISAKVKSGER